ncbi:MAG: fused MFS/spermidine synthase [Candidatus Micrarchaeota archaeon]
MDNRRILFTAFISGGCAMLIEIAGGRAIAPYLGSTIFTWAAIIGLVLGALSVGYYVGGRFADRYADAKHLSYIFIAAAFCTLVIPFLIGLLGPPSIFLNLALASLIVSLAFVPASLFYGMVSPYAIKLTSEPGKEGKSSGKVFAISTVGSILGVLGTGFILVPNMALSHIFILAALLMLGSAFLVSRKGIGIDILVFLILALPISAIGFHPPVSGDLIFSTSSEYFDLNIVNTSLHGKQSLILYLDRVPSSALAVDGSSSFHYINATRLGYELVDNPGRALVIGVAGGTQIGDLRNHFAEMYIDGVEIDAKSIEIGKAYFGLEVDEKTEIIIDDGRRYIKTTDWQYDLVMMDVFRGFSIPYHLSSVEFFREMKEKMSSDGVLVINIILPIDEEPGLIDIFYNTLSAEFENVILIPMDAESTDIQNVVVIATDADTTSFEDMHKKEIFLFEPRNGRIITDDINPADVFVSGR